MSYELTTATTKLLKLKKRIRAVAGGSSAGKTISILQILIDMAQSDPTPTLTSVVSESFPHLRRGAIRDFLNIMESHGYFRDERWSKTDYTYTFETGSKIEFFSADQPGKVRGPRRDRLFVNEINNISKESWDQLILRTRELAFADWNPVTDFFMYEDYGLNDDGIPHTTDKDTDFIILTYKDNEALDQTIISEIEKRRDNKAWYRVYGEGRRGELEGRVYKDWKIIDEIPHEAHLVRRGLDWGFSNDPTAIVDVYRYNEGFILDERLYRTGMLNNEIAIFLNNLEHPNTTVMADSAEPKSIAEVNRAGIPILGVQKKGVTGKSYVRYSIEYVQQQRISVTKQSLNLIKEYRNYLWMADKDGRIINEPTPGNDHLLDAVRYAFDGLRPRTEPVQTTSGNLAQSMWGKR